MKTIIPPIKSQGIKTKLVPWIANVIPDDFQGRWIEPFMGTGVVAFNLSKKDALLCDTNPHIIKFYSSIVEGSLTSDLAKDFLIREGEELCKKGEEHYYFIRDRFNSNFSSLDFLFLNRSCFNGMIRFNKKGKFNIPFCKNNKRFIKSYITKTTNQIKNIERIFKEKIFVFKCQSFEETIKYADDNDIIYCDPPYIDRYSDYYNGWSEENEIALLNALSASPAKFIISTWHHNDFRENKYIEKLWNKYNILTREHFYHVGGELKNRNPMIEAIITNYEVFDRENDFENTHSNRDFYFTVDDRVENLGKNP